MGALDFDGLRRAARRERLRALNPEIAPDAAWGDVGYVVPPPLPREPEAPLRRWLELGLGILATFILFGACFFLACWYFGLIG